MPEHVRITDVSPRDGLQNEPLKPDGTAIPTTEVLKLIAALSTTGVNEIEVTSFVSPKWVPQLADAAGLLHALAGYVAKHRQSGSTRSLPGYSVLIPNEKGLQDCLEAQKTACAAAKIDHLLSGASVITAASETFSQKNTNAGIAESLDRIKPVITGAQNNQLTVRGYISCVIACPYEGPIAPEKVAGVAQSLVAAGVDEIDLGDTIGAGRPPSIRAMLEAVIGALGPHWLQRLTLHLHDTHGTAIRCVREALDIGIRAFDGSVAGLGGCPYASKPGNPAPGNVATESLVRAIHDAGFLTSIDPAQLTKAADFARYLISENRSKAALRTVHR